MEPPLPRPRRHPPPFHRHTGKDQARHFQRVILLNPAAAAAAGSTYGFQIESAVIVQMEYFTCPLGKEPVGGELELVSE